MWATKQQWRVPAQDAERMGAAKTASSADFRDCSHGCGSHSVITMQVLDTPSLPQYTISFFPLQTCKLISQLNRRINDVTNKTLNMEKCVMQ